MMGVAGADMSSGMAQAQARIAAIRDRIEGLTSAPVPFVLGMAEMDAAPEVAPADVDAEVAFAAASASSLDPSAFTVPSAASSAPAAGVDGVTRGAALAAKLPEQGRAWAPAIEQAALKAGIEPALLAAVVRHESNFRPDVVSRAGAIGLAQLMPGTAAGLGVDPHDPQQNLEGGARYLRQQLDRFGSVDLALAAYNAGPNRVAQAGGIPRITETTTYVQRVSATWEQWR